MASGTVTVDGTNTRYLAVDLVRSAALLGMAIYHLTYDLDLFGWIPAGTSVTGFFWYFARSVAGTFIFLAGLSLWLSHGRGIRWRAFFRRLGVIVIAALAVTVVTRLAIPQMMIFYGILHSIAVSSVVGLLFLRLPAILTLAAAAAVVALAYVYSSPAFDGWLVWTGLAGRPVLTADFEPFFPWFAAFLAGIATGRILTHLSLWPYLTLTETPLLRRLAWPSRHSLAVYLIHQPVLISLVFAATWIAYRI